MEIFEESGMTFGPFSEAQVFRVEKSNSYKELGGSVKTVEFFLRKNKDKLLFIEAKSSSPKPEGESFDPYAISPDNPSADDPFEIGQMDDKEAEQAIRGILLRSQGDKLKVSHRNRVNKVRILVDRSRQRMLIQTTAALLIGLAVGILMKFVFPPVLSGGLTTYLLNPIKTMFMNALRIVIGPVIFFSIISCISGFRDLTELGRIGIKVMGTYLFTTLIAILLAFGISMVLKPGTFGFAMPMAGNMGAVNVDLSVDTSLLHTIINIVPSNLLSPFLESNTLQIIFLAVLCGIAVGLIGEHTSLLKEFFEACNSLFLTITTLITRLIPEVVFCSVAMIKKNWEGMLTSLMLSSSSAVIPTNIRICTEKFGVSPKVCNFSIPLGATINMDGTCIYLTITGLFLARAFGVPVPTSMMVSLAITIILISLGCPGIPGAGMVCLGIVLSQIAVPIEAIGLIMGINPFLDMFCTMSNTTGDVAASLIVARSEGLIDLDIYNSKG